jgi:hypothetical protein
VVTGSEMLAVSCAITEMKALKIRLIEIIVLFITKKALIRIVLCENTFPWNG